MERILLDNDEKEFLNRLISLKQRACMDCKRLEYCKGIKHRCLEIWEEDNKLAMKCENFKKGQHQE